MEVPVRKITAQAFRQMEFGEDDRFYYELINGEVVKKSAPTSQHQRIVKKLAYQMESWIQSKDLGELLWAPLDVFLDDYNLFQPDLLFIKNENRFRIDPDDGVIGPPDLVVEVISPSSIRQDRFSKKDNCERYGVAEYWLVDPANATIEIYRLREGKYELADFAGKEGKITSEILGGQVIELSSIFD